MPSAEVIQSLGLPAISTSAPGTQPAGGSAINPFAAILPLLTSAVDQTKGESKPAGLLIAKGLPPLPRKLVEKARSLEFVEMEEFLPTPRSLRLAEQRKPNTSLQDSLVGALDQFQAIQQQKSLQRVLDIGTWTRCFTLYITVMASARAEMVPIMVAHLHTVHKKAPRSKAWLEYDAQYCMEVAASEDKTWKTVDSWQYISCLPDPSGGPDPFEMAGGSQAQTPTPPVQLPGPSNRPLEVSVLDKGKGPANGQPTPKKAKKSGACKWFNITPGGCPYGKACQFIHRCLNCGALNFHTTAMCPYPRKSYPGQN